MRAAGLLGLSPRTYRRACRPPNGLERIFDDLGPLYGGHILADSMLVPLIPGGAAIRAIRSPSDVIGSNPKSPRRPRNRSQTAVRALTALQGVQCHLKCKRFLAKKKTVEGMGPRRLPGPLPLI